MSLKEQFIAYLKHYADKNLEKIADMFADDVTLRDWSISVVGKVAALAETEKNFSSARSIEIEVLRTYESAESVAGELRITVNETEVLYVVDVVTFGRDGKIEAVRAYIGRGD
ncbi:MAG: nuclear transport factor 2 family protein [Aeromonadaceae bacterium]